MNKETLPINSLLTDQLIQQRDKTLQSVEKREYHIGLIGQCKIKDGSSFENSLELGLRRADAKGRLAQDQEKLNDINQELSAYQQAKQYLDKVKLRQTQLDLMSQMVAQGNLFPQILEKHQNEYQELTLLSETDPVLARGIARIRQEEKNETPQEPTLTENHKLTGKPAQLIDLLKESSPDNPITPDNLIEGLWPGTDNKSGRNKLSVLVSATRRKLQEKGSDLNIVVIDSPNKRNGQKATYYLINNNQVSQISETTQPDETPKNTDAVTADKSQTSENKETDSINKPEFGTLSRADIFLIASAFELNRKNLEEMLEKYGIELIGKTTMDQLINLIGDADIANLNGMTNQQKSDHIIQLKIQALQKTKDLIESPQADEILEKIYEKNPGVWYLLAKLEDINNRLKGIAKTKNNYYENKQGITLLTDFLTDFKETMWSYDVTDSHGVKSREHTDRRDKPSSFECSGKN